MAPRRPPVDLSAPLPSSTSPPVTQADIQTVLAAIEDLNSRLPAEAEGRTAPAAVVTKADIEACVAASIGDLGPRLSADMDGKVRAALDEVRSQLSGGEMLSGLARTLEKNGQIVEAVSERMAVNNETLQTLIGLLQSVADTHGRFDERVSRLAEAQSGALERLEAWKRDIPADIRAVIERDAARETGETVRLAERFTGLEAGMAAQRTDLTAMRDAITMTGHDTAEKLSGVKTALDETSGGLRKLVSDFFQSAKVADLDRVHVNNRVGSIDRRLIWILWLVLFVFAHEVYQVLKYRVGMHMPF
ncbi:MAG: hypothetical protein OXQ84_05770 [bacterium]|nr:hypothetical protein [bacterium]